MAANPKPPPLLLHLLILLSTLSLQITTSPSMQAEALVKWKNSLYPRPPRHPLTSWSLSNLNNLCNWTSIVCDSTGTVSEINLSGGESGDEFKLNGTLAQFNFTPFLNLTSFDLSHNNLSGPIPSEIGRLTELQYVSLLGNYLDGKIQHQITNLQKVWYLDLGSNLLVNSDWSKFSTMPLFVKVYKSQVRTNAATVAPSFASSVPNEECRGVRRTIAYHMRSFAHAANINLAPSANDRKSFAAHRSLHQKSLQPTISTLLVQQGKSCLVPSNMERSQLSQNLLCQYL
jgi:hypothetical protein